MVEMINGSVDGVSDTTSGAPLVGRNSALSNSTPDIIDLLREIGIEPGRRQCN